MTGMKGSCAPHPRGFTMIEVIAVLLIVGIIAAVALSRIGSTSSYTLASEVDILKMHLRYVQYRAFSDDVTWGMSFAAGSYTMQKNGATAPNNLPNESSPTHTLPGGYSVTGTTVAFDEWGSPGAADITVTLTGGGESRSFTITKNTGFIP